MGHFGGDWTHAQYKKTVQDAILRGEKSVTLCTEHCSSVSDMSIRDWAKEDGFRVKIGFDDITVIFSKED